MQVQAIVLVVSLIVWELNPHKEVQHISNSARIITYGLVVWILKSPKRINSKIEWLYTWDRLSILFVREIRRIFDKILIKFWYHFGFITTKFWCKEMPWVSDNTIFGLFNNFRYMWLVLIKRNTSIYLNPNCKSYNCTFLLKYSDQLYTM